MPDATTSAPPRPMIQLVDLTKTYPGQTATAIDGLSLDIPEGEIVVFVGPSGCGKTTTMKLINRLIEPTSGRIMIDGQDVTHTDPDRLRRGIGYAIQQTGLFPHRTVAENIGTVPRLLGWDRRRVDGRVEELLIMVGLSPDTYRDRYPKQLSGGQQQRVGVARALAADPPVLLMDEPFGAIDPLTRETLQNELLRIQRAIRKTIVFVTHDIDEAVKLGDRIAIFAEGGRVVQYDVPKRILGEPADDFVSDFIGAGASVKRLSLTRIGDVEGLPGADADHEDGGLPLVNPMGPDHTLYDALDAMLSNSTDGVAVTDGAGRYRGTLTLETIQDLVRSGSTGAPRQSRSPVAHRSGER